MIRRALTWLDRRAIPILAAGIITLAVGVTVNSVQIAGQARAGDAARDRQCLLAGTFEKIVTAAHSYELIDDFDLAAYEAVGAPVGCPPRERLLRELEANRNG